MGAVWMRAKNDLRARWRGGVVLALVPGVAGGIVIANLVAALPGRPAARVQPAVVLRSE
jgi:hypothetical protein